MRTKTNRQVIGKVVVLGLLLSLLVSTSLFQETINAQISTQLNTFPTPPPTSDLKVMTWNILGGRGCTLYRHMEKVADAIMKHEGLDVIALQEVHRAQASELARQLKKKGFGEFDTHFFTMKECDDSGKDFGLAFLSRTPILTSFLLKPRAYPLPHAPDPNPNTKNPCDRGLKRILAAITTRVRGTTVRVYNTHLTACGGTSAQRRQADAIIRLIKIEEGVYEFFFESSFRPILMGDMNAPPSRGAHSILTERFIDAWGNRGGGLTFPTRDPDARIDYIFVGRGDFRVDDIRVTSNQSLVNTFNIPGINKPEDLPKDPDALQPIPDHLPVTALLSFD